MLRVPFLTDAPGFPPNDRDMSTEPELGIYGIPTSFEQAQLVYIPVPWDATCSYHAGTSQGPQGILKASDQVDLFDMELKDIYAAGLHCLPISEALQSWNTVARTKAETLMAPQSHELDPAGQKERLLLVNELCEKMEAHVYEECLNVLNTGKVAVVVGGDHSTSRPAIRAYAQHHKSFGILHVDAHMDLRKQYQGFTHSHASVMHSVIEDIPEVKKLVQVGIRDYSEEEVHYQKSKKRKIIPYFDHTLSIRRSNGTSWSAMTQEIIQNLPNKVYLSVDIDGLDPALCPNTGTPVAGGLQYNDLLHLVRQLVHSGKKIIGMDLVEVSPHPDGKNDWDCNVASRLLYKLSGWLLASQKKIKFS